VARLGRWQRVVLRGEAALLALQQPPHRQPGPCFVAASECVAQRTSLSNCPESPFAQRLFWAPLSSGLSPILAGGEQIIWTEPTYDAVHDVLVYPADAGAYVFGKARQQRYVDADGALLRGLASCGICGASWPSTATARTKRPWTTTAPAPDSWLAVGDVASAGRGERLARLQSQIADHQPPAAEARFCISCLSRRNTGSGRWSFRP
jgi:hypothetical protein